MDKIIVVKARGKGRENANLISVHIFDTVGEAKTFIQDNNDLESKYWTYCEIVQNGQELEPYYGEF